MEVVAAVGLCVAVPFLYSAIRPRFKTTVNCWFCNTNSRVNYANRNSFVCSSCEQYNGFKNDGDYNRRIPEQSYTTPTRFCKPAKKVIKPRNRPDLIPERFGKLNMSPKNENGLCTECNQNQETIMKKVADFEPLDEDRWNDELEDYRYKLDRMYPLCPRCTLAVHGKIEEDKKKYSYLFGFKNNLKHAIGSTINQFINPAGRKSRSFFFAGGRLCESLRFLVLISMIALFMADTDFLQQDAGVTFVTYPNYIQLLLPFIHSHSLFIHIGVLLAHFIACYNSKCRISFSDLVLPAIHTISLLTFAAETEKYGEDLALIRFACSSLVAVSAAVSSLVPRKKLHRKRVNKILSSAFSIASTPASQCSSQASQNTSMVDQHTHIPRDQRHSPRSPSDRSVSPPSSSSPRSIRIPFGGAGISNHIQPPSPQGSSSPNSTSPSSMRWRERAQSPVIETTRRRRNQREKENSEAMDWDDSQSVSHSVAPSITRSYFRPSIFEQAASLRGMERDSTPSRELAPSVASMSLFTARDGGTASVFSARTARPLASNLGSSSPFVRQNRMMQSPARSVFAPKSFVGTPRSEKVYLPDAHTRTGSVFTSISQQDRDSVIGGIWQCRVVVIMFSLIFIVLVMQVVVFYMLLKK